MSGCVGCDALRKAAPSILAFMTPNDDILCGYHASELMKENEHLRKVSDELKNFVGEGALCISWIEIWKGTRGQCRMPESWVGHHDRSHPFFHTFFSGRKA